MRSVYCHRDAPVAVSVSCDVRSAVAVNVDDALAMSAQVEVPASI